MSLRVWTPVGGTAAFLGAQSMDELQVAVLRYAAAERGIIIETIHAPFRRFHYGGRNHIFASSVPDTMGAVARRLMENKHVTKLLLAGAGLSVPRGEVFEPHQRAEAWAFARQLGLPVVVKPLKGTGGQGVTAGIATETLFHQSWTATRAKRGVVVEQMVGGRDHRLLVVGDHMVLTCWRRRASVLGDGISTVTELIAKENEKRVGNPEFSEKPVVLSPAMQSFIAEEGLGPDSVLELNRRVLLTYTANTAQGGANLDVTEQVHPGFAEIAVRAKQAFPGAFYAGIDLLTADISKAPTPDNYAICEVNSAPNLSFHHFALAGPARDAAGAVMEALFPGATPVPPEEWRRVRLDAINCPPGAAAVLWRHAALNAVAGRITAGGNHSVSAELCGPSPALDDVLRLFTEAHGGARLGLTSSDASPVLALEAIGFNPGVD